MASAVPLEHAPAAVPPEPRPGRCSDHPNLELVTHRRARVRWPFLEDPAVVCPDPSHDMNSRERCQWCGGPLAAYVATASPRRAFCTPLHRLQAHRASRATT